MLATADIQRSPPIPRGLTAAPPSAATQPSAPSQNLVTSASLGTPKTRGGATPTMATPQERFRDAMLALDEKNTREAGHDSQKRGAQQAPRPTIGPNTFPTIQPKMEPHVPGAISRGAGNPRSVPSGRSAAGPIQLLSEWCQKHHFNPTWQLKPLPGGKLIGGEVKLLEHSVVTDQAYDTIFAAKTALAQKALRVVQTRGWPLAIPRSTSESQPPRNAAPTQTRDPRAWRRSSNTIMTHVGPRTRVPPHERDESARGNAELLGHLRQVVGTEMPDPSLEDPQTARAFLEGLAAGVRLAGPSLRERNSRSQSPSSRPATNRRRERSPLRPGRDVNRQGRRGRGRRGRSPNHNRYRPSPSRGSGSEWVVRGSDSRMLTLSCRFQPSPRSP